MIELKLETNGRTLRVGIVGEEALDGLNALDFKTQLLGRVGPEPNLVLLLDPILSIDSAGVGALVALLKAVKKLGGRMILAGVQPQVLSVLDIIRLTTVFEIVPDEEAALHALAA